MLERRGGGDDDDDGGKVCVLRAEDNQRTNEHSEKVQIPGEVFQSVSFVFFN